MRFFKDGDALVGRQENETLRIEPWGTNALRVRAARRASFSGEDHALTEKVRRTADEIEILETENGTEARIRNGKISAVVNRVGIITFFSGEKKLLREYYSNYDGSITRESECFKIISREFKGFSSDSFRLTVRFESDPNEKIYGMGQYQQPYLNVKGCVLELEQRNSQVSVPFMLSNLGYGLLWNHPGTGSVVFGRNITKYADRTILRRGSISSGSTIPSRTGSSTISTTCATAPAGAPRWAASTRRNTRRHFMTG